MENFIARGKLTGIFKPKKVNDHLIMNVVTNEKLLDEYEMTKLFLKIDPIMSVSPMAKALLKMDEFYRGLLKRKDNERGQLFMRSGF